MIQSAATMQIMQMEAAGATKLISGLPQFESHDFKVAVKAIYQTNELLVLNLNKLGNQSSYGKVESGHVSLYKPSMLVETAALHRDRPHLFSSECATVVTQDGQIFVMGGKYKCSYIKANVELVVDFLVSAHAQAGSL